MIEFDAIGRKHGNGIARNKRSVNKHIPTWDQARVSALPVVLTDVYNYAIPVVVPCEPEPETVSRFTIRKTDKGRFEIVDGLNGVVWECHTHYAKAKNSAQLLNRNAQRIPIRTT